MSTVPDAFVEWVIKECEDRHWSWNYASEKAGLARGSISAWVNREKQPGLHACKALAKLFRKPPEFVLQLAGHLPKPSDARPSSEALDAAYTIDSLDRPVREQVLGLIHTLGEEEE